MKALFWKKAARQEAKCRKQARGYGQSLKRQSIITSNKHQKKEEQEQEQYGKHGLLGPSEIEAFHVAVVFSFCALAGPKP